MIKVLFLSHWYPNRYDNMVGLFVQKHAEAVSLFCNVATLYVHPDGNLKKQEIEITNEKGFTEIKIYFPAKGNSIVAQLTKHYNYLKAYRTGFKLLKQTWGMPNIIQANIFTRTALIASIIKIWYKIPYVVIEHWTRYFREITFHNFLHKILSIYAAKQASAIMPVTSHLKTCMELHGMKNNNYQIVNNVVDNIFFENISKPNVEKIRILNVTCFDDNHKNLSGLINVIYTLYQKRQDFEIYLVGNGNDFDKIKKQVIKLGLENNVVHFTGKLTGKPLVEMFQKSHFSVLFSNYENIPVVISESLVCGIPVVSTNVGGISEHIDKTNGILIDAKDEKALFVSLDYMIDNYKEYNALLMKEIAYSKYSYHAVGKRLFSIYSNILQK